MSARATGTLIQATRLEARVRALAGLMTEAGSPALVVSSAPRMQASLLERALPGRGVAWLGANLVAAEWDLRLAEVVAGIYSLIVVDARLLWDSQFMVALARNVPRLVAFDVTPDAEVDSADRWALALQIARVRQVFPATMIAAVGTPTSSWARDWLAARLGSTAALPREDLVPPGVALRSVRAGAERDRWGAVLDAAPPPGAPMLLVTPSRSGAIAAAKRLGSTASAYHGGLLLSERAAILEAYRRRQPRTLVVTQTLPRTDDLPPPAAIVLTHPPRHPEILTYLMGWAARANAPIPLLVVYAPSDLAAARAGGSHPRPTLSDLRDVYRATRRLARQGYARILPEALAPTDGPFRGQTALAVSGLHALEAAGYLSRGDDVSRATTLTVLVTESASLVERGLPPMEVGAAPPVDPLVAAFEQGLDPIQWQRRAAAAALDGLLLYRSAGRERLYRLREPVRDAAGALRRDIRERVEWAADDARLIASWLEAPGCRARALASGMGWPVPHPCGLCDTCVPPPRGSDFAPNEPWRLALRALADIPLAVPEGAAERIVRQALRRSGGTGDRKTAMAALTRLRDGHLIRLEAGAMQPRIVVTDQGRALLTGRPNAVGNSG
ncbi:MAG TPA: hypothetical protein VN837_08880 [Chloroflexota bacterium]|nr:hypothetical protein [Chloroflexota bacterium]